MNREFEKIIRERRSIRKFRPDPVPEKTILELVELASWAPSAGNRQDWFFSVARSPELIRKMADLVKEKWQRIISENSSSGRFSKARRVSILSTMPRSGLPSSIRRSRKA